MDFGENDVLENFFKTNPIISFKVVFPQLPVIEIILALIFSLNIDEHIVKNFRVFLTLICFKSE